MAAFPGRGFAVLDGALFSRVLGPAFEIAFLAVDHGGVRRVVADAALPPAPGGMLAIRSDQIEALNARRMSALRSPRSNHNPTDPAPPIDSRRTEIDLAGYRKITR